MGNTYIQQRKKGIAFVERLGKKTSWPREKERGGGRVESALTRLDNEDHIEKSPPPRGKLRLDKGSREKRPGLQGENVPQMPRLLKKDFMKKGTLWGSPEEKGEKDSAGELLRETSPTLHPERDGRNDFEKPEKGRECWPLVLLDEGRYSRIRKGKKKRKRGTQKRIHHAQSGAGRTTAPTKGKEEIWSEEKKPQTTQANRKGNLTPNGRKEERQVGGQFVSTILSSNVNRERGGKAR